MAALRPCDARPHAGLALGSDTLIENFADNGGITDDDEADEADRGDGDGDGRELPDTATVGEAGDAPARD